MTMVELVVIFLWVMKVPISFVGCVVVGKVVVGCLVRRGVYAMVTALFPTAPLSVIAPAPFDGIVGTSCRTLKVEIFLKTKNYELVVMIICCCVVSSLGLGLSCCRRAGHRGVG